MYVLMKRATFACAALCVLSTAALSEPQWYTVAQWERFSRVQRSAYIAGAIDATMAGGGAKIEGLFKVMAARQHACLLRSKITMSQLADGVYDMVQQNPAFRSRAMVDVITTYLGKMCPDLLGPDALDGDEALRSK